MKEGFTITIVDVDDDYLGIDIQVANKRYSGNSRIYSDLEKIHNIANVLEGFPKHHEDERTLALGTQEPGYAGGYCYLHFYVLDHGGHTAVDVSIEDDDSHYSAAKATLTIRPIVGSDIDRFVAELRKITGKYHFESATLSPSMES